MAECRWALAAPGIMSWTIVRTMSTSEMAGGREIMGVHAWRRIRRAIAGRSGAGEMVIFGQASSGRLADEPAAVARGLRAQPPATRPLTIDGPRMGAFVAGAAVDWPAGHPATSPAA